MQFDHECWIDPSSTDYVTGDITARQKMLADVVYTVMPRKNRAEIENLLGPSLETSYFNSTGRDLIYILGPQRDAIFAIDSEWLLIWFDDYDQFSRYEIVCD